jgi:putative phosphoesterase
MGKVAVFADIHADAKALQSALNQAVRLGCDRAVCAGDLISYGTEPLQTIRILRENHVACVRGNHDRWAARDGMDFGDHPLPDEVIDYLMVQPPSMTFTVDDTRVLVSHAWPSDDMNGIKPDTLDEDIDELLSSYHAPIWLTGHTHHVYKREVLNRWVFNPGSVLRDPAPKYAGVPHTGTFGILDAVHRKFAVYPIE